MAARNLPKYIIAGVSALLILAVGGAIFAGMVLTAPRPDEKPQTDAGPLVRAFVARPQTHQVAVTAYGTSKPRTEWDAIAEVRGRTVQVHDRLDPGELIREGDMLVQVDQAEYQNAITQLEAQKQATQEEINRLDRTLVNSEDILALHRNQEALAKSEYDRLKTLRERGGSISQSELDRVYRDYLGAQASADKLQDDRELIPIDKARLQANIKAIDAQLSDAQRNLDKTTITMPFNGFCAEAHVEQDQVVSVGQNLGTFVPIDVAEVEAQLEVRKGYMLWPFEGPGIKFDLSNPETIRVLKSLVPATVQPVSHPDVQFRGTVVRAQFTDPISRTLPVVIEVRDPYKDAEIGKRPPLSPNMFCKVMLYGAVLSDVFVVPRESLRDGRLHLARDGKLHIVAVNAPVLEESLAVVNEGLQEGDVVLLSEVFPAVEGMPLRVRKVDNPVSARTPWGAEESRP